MTAKPIHKTTLNVVRKEVWVCLFLVLATLWVYWQVRNYDFINFDDDFYVTENRFVRSGVTQESVAWSFSFADKDKTYWHPLTWLSHILDVQLYGMDAGRHHLTNLLFHIANILLLFLVLRRMTGAVWRSALVAALFAFHPLNVESVAWVAERKNVLSTFFWMLTLLAYSAYAERPGLLRYLLVFFVFAAGLLAKPMLVTLPFVLFLLDYWPLKRFQFGRKTGDQSGTTRRFFAFRHRGSPGFGLVLEKIPLMMLSLVSIFLSSLSLQRFGTVVPLENLSMKLRIANALVSYVRYIAKMIWPHHLAIFYPYPDRLPLWQTTAALLFLFAVSLMVIRLLNRQPYLGVGWFWYLGTLLPVSGLMQAGLWPAMADRWAYVSMIGLFIMIAWSVSALMAGGNRRRFGLGVITLAIVFGLMVSTRLQVQYWRNSISLFQHIVDIYPENWLAHNNLGTALATRDRTLETYNHFSKALRLKPNSAYVHVNYGNSLLARGKIDEAIDHFSEALRIDSEIARAYNSLGLALIRKGKLNEAILNFQLALRKSPAYANAYNNLKLALSIHKQINRAVEDMRAALNFEPDDPALDSRIEEFLKRKRVLSQALNRYHKSLSRQPGFSGLDINEIDIISEVMQAVDEALPLFKKIIKFRPDSAGVYYIIACIYSRQGNTRESITWLNSAIQKGFNDWDLIRTDFDLENIRNSAYYFRLVESQNV